MSPVMTHFSDTLRKTRIPNATVYENLKTSIGVQRMDVHDAGVLEILRSYYS